MIEHDTSDTNEVRIDLIMTRDPCLPFALGAPLPVAPGYPTEPWIVERIIPDAAGDFLVVCFPDVGSAEEYDPEAKLDEDDDIALSIHEYRRLAADWAKAGKRKTRLIRNDEVLSIDYAMYSTELLDEFIAEHMRLSEEPEPEPESEPDSDDDIDPGEAGASDAENEAS